MGFSSFFIAVSATIIAAPAMAQWSGSIGSGVRNFHLTERDMVGHAIVREAGNLVGIATDGAYDNGSVRLFSNAEIYAGTIDYRGQTQLGQAIASDTAHRMVDLRFGAIYRINAGVGVLAALEWERWQRDIHGVPGASGLQERATTARVIAGADTHWLWPQYGELTIEAALVHARPEHVAIAFSGALDPAHLTTHPSTGLRLEARFRPEPAPKAEVRVRYDTSRIARSDRVGVTKQGTQAGTVAQPARSLRALTASLHYLF